GRRVARGRERRGRGQFEAELEVSLEAEARLEDCRVCELRVDLRYAAVGAVVEASIDADRPVDAVHHTTARAGEAAQAPEVEVERVVEADRSGAGDPIDLDREAAALELLRQRTEELGAAAGGRGQELVEDGEVSARPPRAHPVGLRADAVGRGPPCLPADDDGRSTECPHVHGTECRSAASRRRPWSDST